MNTHLYRNRGGGLDSSLGFLRNVLYGNENAKNDIQEKKEEIKNAVENIVEELLEDKLYFVMRVAPTDHAGDSVEDGKMRTSNQVEQLLDDIEQRVSNGWRKVTTAGQAKGEIDDTNDTNIWDNGGDLIMDSLLLYCKELNDLKGVIGTHQLKVMMFPKVRAFITEEIKRPWKFGGGSMVDPDKKMSAVHKVKFYS